MKILKVSNLFLSIFVLLAVGITPFLTGCAKAYTIPPKIFPAFGMYFHFPEGGEHGPLSIDPGKTMILSITVSNLVNVPIAVWLVKWDKPHKVPDFITLVTKNAYTSIQPSENITLEVSCTVKENSPTGLYWAAIKCETKDPVPDRGSMQTYSFQIKVN